METITDAIAASIVKERAKLQADVERLTAELTAADILLSQRGEEQSKAWELVVAKSGKEGKLDNCPPEVMKAASLADRYYTSQTNAVSTLEARLRRAKLRLKELDMPQEQERRVEKRAGLMRLREKKAADPLARDQGFPEAYLAESGKFKPGFDSKAASDLACALMHRPKPDALHQFTKAEAEKLIEARPQLALKVQKLCKGLGPQSVRKRT